MSERAYNNVNELIKQQDRGFIFNAGHLGEAKRLGLSDLFEEKDQIQVMGDEGVLEVWAKKDVKELLVYCKRRPLKVFQVVEMMALQLGQYSVSTNFDAATEAIASGDYEYAITLLEESLDTINLINYQKEQVVQFLVGLGEIDSKMSNELAIKHRDAQLLKLKSQVERITDEAKQEVNLLQAKLDVDEKLGR